MADYTDDFNRADSDLTSPWTTWGGSGCTIVGNEVRAKAASSTDVSRYTLTAAAEQFSKLTIATITGTDFEFCGVCTRLSTSSGASGYYARAFRNHTSTSDLISVVASSETSIGSEAATTWAATNTLVGAARGSEITLFRNGGSLLRATNSDNASGSVGIMCQVNVSAGSLADVEIDSFFGGDLSSVTVRPAGDGTTTSWTRVAASGTFASKIVDDPDSNDGDTSYVQSPNVTDGQMWVTLDAMPSDFDLGVSVDIKAAAKKVNTPVMTVDLSDMYLQLERSDESTDITAESSVCNVTDTANYVSFNRTCAVSGTHTKTNWDAARLRLRFDHTTQSTVDTTNQIRITAAEVLIYYMPTPTVMMGTSCLVV